MLPNRCIKNIINSYTVAEQNLRFILHKISNSDILKLVSVDD